MQDVDDAQVLARREPKPALPAAGTLSPGHSSAPFAVIRLPDVTRWGDISAGAHPGAEGSTVKFFPLVWAGLWRRPTRTILTAFSIVVAFVLLGLLEGVNAGFAKTIAGAHRDFLVTGTRVRGGAPMPISSMARIQSLPGVRDVAPRAYFTGVYRELGEKNMAAAIATQPELFFRMQPRMVVSRKDLDTLREDRAGMIATTAMLEWFGWKVGDTVILRSPTPKTDGTSEWTFHIIGTIGMPPDASPTYFGVINYDYFDEYRVTDRGTAEIFYVRIDDPTKAVAMSAAIDRIFANSPHETRTRSQQARAELQAKQMGDVRFFTNAVMGAVLFTLAFLTGNTLRQALQERARDFAVLRALGYSNAGVLGLAYAEALLLYLPPAVLGLLIAYFAAPLAREDIGRIVVSPGVAAAGLLCAACLAFLGAVLPASNVSRLPIATALGKR